ncbi:MAG: lactonase family protein [Dehalococcoidia bacterium]|nr:lactonase family protein [Dehalococcoidia bacterium]
MKNEMEFYVGTYTRMGSDGIYHVNLDLQSGKMEEISVTGGVENPSFLAINSTNDRLYSVGEITEDGRRGSVSSFSIKDDGSLTLLGSEQTGGPGPCHLSVVPGDGSVIVTNYAGGSVCMFPVNSESGILEKYSDFHQHEGSSVNKDRQEMPHAHSVTVDKNSKFAYVCDLGKDMIIVYEIDNKGRKLIERNDMNVVVDPGEGPRHFDFHPSLNYAYGINEIGSTISVYDYDRSTGVLSTNQKIPTLPENFDGFNGTADIHVSPDGLFVYGSNRGHDSIVIFSIDQSSGKIHYVGHESSRGETPRNFAMTPSGDLLLAENQDTGDIFSFYRDKTSGKLEFTGESITIPAPVCIKFLNGN